MSMRGFQSRGLVRLLAGGLALGLLVVAGRLLMGSLLRSGHTAAADKPPGISGYHATALALDASRLFLKNTEPPPARADMAVGSELPDFSAKTRDAPKSISKAAVQAELLRKLVQSGDDAVLASVIGKLLGIAPADPFYKTYTAPLSSCTNQVVVHWLCEFLEQTKDPAARDRVLYLLASLEGPDVALSLASQIKQAQDPATLRELGALLATSTAPAQIPALAQLLATPGLDAIQTLAAYGLASIGNAEACACLVTRALSSDTDYASCLAALASVRSPYSQEFLLAAARDATLPEPVRVAVVQSLAQQNSPRVQTVLANMTGTVSDSTFQQALQTALQTMAQQQIANGSAQETVGGELWF